MKNMYLAIMIITGLTVNVLHPEYTSLVTTGLVGLVVYLISKWEGKAQ